MKTSAVARPMASFSSSRSDFRSPRNQFYFPQRISICRAEYAITGGSFNVRVVPPSLLVAEKEEAKAVLSLFLKKWGLSHMIATRTINKADFFVDHLISRLHSVHKSRYLVGRELTTQEIRDALIPYLETLLEEHGDILENLVENFSSAPGEQGTWEIQQKPSVIERSTAPISPPNTVLDTNHLDTTQRRALARVSDIASEGKFPPHILYLMDLGMEIEVIRKIIKKFPPFSYYTLDGKIKPFVEFLLDIGVPKSDIPIILGKRPTLCGISLTENLIPTMGFLEELGVDKKQWAKVIYRFPALLTYSRTKLKAAVDFFYEMGVSSENVGRILTRCPQIVSYNVEDKLRPTAEYFCSLGVDVAVLLARCPQNFGLSIEANLKPVTEFFLERGYTIDEVGTMISRYGALYTFSLSENLVPKWEYFLTMDYPKSELIKFPQYFGYSLVGRIQPRYAIVKKSGVRMLLNQVLSLSDQNFDIILKKKLKKMSNG